MRTGMIVLAGGMGTRIGRPIPKQFLLLGGKPLIVHVLEKAAAIADIEQVVIACPAAFIEQTVQLIENHRLGGKFRCVEGGTTRQESAYRALLELGDIESVLIHEAVRPLVTVDEFRALIDAAEPNVMYGLEIPFTVLRGHEFVEGILDRSELVNVQLPHKFELAKLLGAHEAARRDGADFTEDASLFYQYTGEPVRILGGSERNIKITVPTDIVAAEALYADFVGRGS